MSSNETMSLDDGNANRTLAALSLALASGQSLGDVEIDLSDPVQCRFGAYTLVERIGGGGMGVVYRAHQESLERDVAIKLLNINLADDAEALARFRFEAKSAAALNHPNIVQVLEIGQEQGIAFIAMQLVRGNTLADRIQLERMSPRDAVAMMLKLCDAVGYAHRLHLLHLDLKPANVLIDERGEPMVADFGLARRMDAKGQVEAQEVSGTPAYMAPEQVLIKQYRLSPATDIYALGAILYEMLCGISPHGRGAPADVMRRALAGQIPSPRQFNSGVPRDLEAICLKCLGLDSADRYQNVEALAEDLRRYANALPVSVRKPSLHERVQRWYAREPRFVLATIALMLLAIGGSVVMTGLYRNAERQRAGAEGIVRILMAQTPVEAPPVVHVQKTFKVPLIDCTLVNVNCNGDLEPDTTIDPTLPIAQRRAYLESLRDYVPKIAAWGNPRLSAQLANALGNVESDLYRSRRAFAAAATGTADGYVFAFLLADSSGDPELGNLQARAWLAQAVARIDQPWQAQVLAQSCDVADPNCIKAIERFRALDPDNAAAWLIGVPIVPGAQGDRLLLRAAAAPHISHSGSAILDAAGTFGARLMPTLDPEARIAPAAFQLEVLGRIGPFAYPAGYCQHSLAERDAPAIEAACEAIVRKIQPGMKPSLIDEIIAGVLTVRLSPDPAVRAQGWQRLRNARWIYSAWKQLPPGQEEPDAAHHVQMARDKGEFAYLESLVAAAHLPLEAPEEFVTKEPLPWPRFNPVPGHQPR